MIRNLFKNAYIINMMNKVMSLLLGFVTSIFVARYMGASLKGDYAYIVSVAGILNIVLNLGIYHTYPNQVKKGLQNAKQKFIDIYVLQFLIYEVLAVLLGLLVSDPLILLIGVLAPVMTLASQITMIGMVDFPIYRSLSLIGVAAFNLAAYMCLFFFFPKSIWLSVLVLILKDILFVCLILGKLKIMPHPFRAERELTKEAIKFGMFPMLTALLLNLNYKMDIIMIRAFGTSAWAGIYSVAVTIADYLWLIPDAFKEVLFSKSVQENATDAFNASIKISVILTTMASGVLLVFGYWFIPVIYGKGFESVYSIMVILLIGIPFMSIFKILSPLYVTQGDTKSYFINLLCGIVCNVILNIILIPRLGLAGAAAATITSQIVCGIYAITRYIKKNEVPMKDIFTITSREKEMIKGFIRKS